MSVCANTISISKIILLATLLVSSLFAVAEDKKKLQQKYEKLQKEIKEIDKDLKQIAVSKKESVGQVQVLNAKIKTREAAINTVSDQLSVVRNEIGSATKDVQHAQSEVATLKKEFGDMLYGTYKNMSLGSELLFVLSSKSFSQAFHRLLYLKSFGSHRQAQVRAINHSIELLNGQIAKLDSVQTEKAKLLDTEKLQRNTLVSEKQQKDELVKKLVKDEKSLSAKAKDKNNEAKKLNAQIQSIIEKEIAEAKKKAEEEAKKKAATTTGQTSSKTTTTKAATDLGLTPEEAALSKDFASNMGKLPWPVTKGYVILPFGNQPHPTVKGVTIENNGVDIKTSVASDVRALFSGTVVSVFFMPATQNCVMIKHGEYFTVYSNLKSVNVKKGDAVSTKQSLGVAFTDEEDETNVHLEIWKGKEKQNPETWLAD